MNTFHRPRFITIYVFTALFFGLLICWIMGAGTTELVTQKGLIDLDDPSNKPDPDYPFGIAPMFLCMGLPFVAFGLIVLATVWFMRKWGVILAILIHLVGISCTIYMIINSLSEGYLRISHIIIYAIWLTGIVAQVYFITWFIRHWSLFRWIRFAPRSTPDMLQIVDNPQ